MTTISHSYNVVDKPGFVNKVKELTKRFKFEYSLTWGSPYSENIEIRRDEVIEVWFNPVTVDFSFDSFKIEGYNYIGCIKDSEMIGFITVHGNDMLGDRDIIDWVKSFETIPCHACNRKHSRKIGHIFHKIETDVFLVFGSSCAKKYFGINFDRILSFFEGFNSKMGEWDGESRGSHYASYINSEILLRDVYFVISKYGYVSVSKSKENDSYPTSFVVTDFRNDPKSDRYRFIDDITEATKDIDFSVVWTTPIITGNSEMDHNIGVIQEKMARNLLSEKDFGWVSFMVWNCFFKPAPAQAVIYTIPTGMVAGDKIENIKASFLGVVHYDSRYGTQTINMFEADGVRYKWFSSVDVCGRYGLEKGDMVTIKKASVKDIEDDVKYGKSVIITRAKIDKI